MLIELGEAAPLLVAVAEPRDKDTAAAQEALSKLGRRLALTNGPNFPQIIRNNNTICSFPHLPVPCLFL